MRNISLPNAHLNAWRSKQPIKKVVSLPSNARRKYISWNALEYYRSSGLEVWWGYQHGSGIYCMPQENVKGDTCMDFRSIDKWTTSRSVDITVDCSLKEQDVNLECVHHLLWVSWMAGFLHGLTGSSYPLPVVLAPARPTKTREWKNGASEKDGMGERQSQQKRREPGSALPCPCGQLREAPQGNVGGQARRGTWRPRKEISGGPQQPGIHQKSWTVDFKNGTKAQHLLHAGTVYYFCTHVNRGSEV